MDVLTSSCKVTRQAAQAQAVATAVQVMTSQRICGEADFPGLSMVYLWLMMGKYRKSMKITIFKYLKK
jgi:hypothetical protein